MRYIALAIGGLAPAVLLGMLSEARAESDDDPANQGFGPSGNNRVTLEGGLASGERPGIFDPSAAPAVGSVPATGQPKEDYARMSAWLNYEYSWYWDKTRFGTLVGAEILLGLGYFAAEKASPERATEPSGNWSKFHGKAEAAFDYAPIHWEGSVAGRFVFGAGAGAEFGSYWHTEDGRTYPLVLTRLQLFPGSTAIDVGYRFVPTTTGDNAVREHRFSGSVGLGAFRLGVGAVLLKVHLPDQRWLSGTTYQGSVGMVF